MFFPQADLIFPAAYCRQIRFFISQFIPLHADNTPQDENPPLPHIIIHIGIRLLLCRSFVRSPMAISSRVRADFLVYTLFNTPLLRIHDIITPETEKRNPLALLHQYIEFQALRLVARSQTHVLSSICASFTTFSSIHK